MKHDYRQQSGSNRGGSMYMYVYFQGSRLQIIIGMLLEIGDEEMELLGI